MDVATAVARAGRWWPGRAKPPAGVPPADPRSQFWPALRLFVLAIAVGLIVGIAADGFRWLLPHANALFFGTFHATGLNLTRSSYRLQHPYIFLLPALGGLLVGLFLHFVAPQAGGHGVAEVLAAMETRGGRIPPQVSAYTAIASSITIGSGGSAGPEGPAIQIGAAIASGVGQWFRLSPDDLRTILACGAATGLAAMYNAPVAGTLFAIEVLLEEIHPRRFALIALAAVTGHFVADHLLANELLVTRPASTEGWQLLPMALGLGLLAGPLGVAFIRLLHFVAERAGQIPVKPWLRPALGGLLVGLIGLFVPRILGTGQQTIQEALLGVFPLGFLLVLMALKLLATSLTLGSGGSGGVFTPSLFMGAMLGGAYGLAMHTLAPNVATTSTFALLGMGTVIASAVSAPLTAIMIVVEFTGDFALMPSLVMAVAGSTLIARYLFDESIYTLPLVLRGIHRPPRAPNPLAGIRVRGALDRAWPTVDPARPVRDLLQMGKGSGQTVFPAVDDQGRLVGLLNTADLAQIVGQGGPDAELSRPAQEFARPAVVVATPDETLHEVLLHPGASELPIIPVVSRRDNHYLGVLQRQAILRIYERRVTSNEVTSNEVAARAHG